MSRDDFKSFTPSEVETVTGLTTVMQRNWRRHGYLPSLEGHARFDVFEVARLMTMRLLSERGIGPKESSKVSEICAIGIVYSALLDSKAYGPEVIKSSLRAENSDLQTISRRIVRDYTGIGIVPSQYFIWWADGAHHFDNSLDRAFPPFEFADSRIEGPVIVLDLKAMGRSLLQKAGKPLVFLSE